MSTAETHPTDTAPVVRLGRDGPQLVEMRWGFEPSGTSEPIINVRAENADLSEGRCLVPATELELFTGAGHPKRGWSVTLRGQSIFFFAGLYRGASHDWPESYALLTIDAAPDLSPLTDRQPAVIRAADAGSWLSGERNPSELVKPLPPGSYEVKSMERP